MRMIIIGRCFGCIQFQLRALRSHLLDARMLFHSFLLRCGILTEPFNKTNKQQQQKRHKNSLKSLKYTKYVFILMLLSFSPFFSPVAIDASARATNWSMPCKKMNWIKRTELERRNKTGLQVWNVPRTYAHFVLKSHTHTHFDVTINRPEAIIKADEKNLLIQWFHEAHTFTHTAYKCYMIKSVRRW